MILLSTRYPLSRPQPSRQRLAGYAIFSTNALPAATFLGSFRFLVVSALDSGLSGPGSSLGQDTLLSQCLSPSPIHCVTQRDVVRRLDCKTVVLELSGKITRR